MGKLHRLRKAIEADPFAFYSGETGVPEPGDWAYGAIKTKEGWMPASGMLCDRRSYRGFVRHVLIKLGHMMTERAARRILLKQRLQRAREIVSSTIEPPPLFSSLSQVSRGEIVRAREFLKRHEKRRS